MYGVIGEDKSDVETLKELMFRIAGDRSLKIKGRGYNSCGEMLRKGPTQLKIWRIQIRSATTHVGLV